MIKMFELVVMVAQPCLDTKTTETYFKMVNFVVYDLYSIKKEEGAPGMQRRDLF